MNIEEQIKEKLAGYGLDLTDITDDEYRKIKLELEYVNAGGMILDSVCDEMDLLGRGFAKHGKGE